MTARHRASGSTVLGLVVAGTGFAIVVAVVVAVLR